MKLNPLKILNELSFERIAGSENEKKAAAIIENYLKLLKLDMVPEEFTVYSFDTGTGMLSVGNKQIPVHPYGLNKNCTLSKEMVFLENPEIMRHNKGRYRDKIVLSFGYTRKIQEIINEQQLAAYIAISTPFREASSSSHRQKTYLDGYINSATIKYDDALRLIKHSGETVGLKIVQKVEERKAYNLIVDIEGSNPDDNMTYLVAHYDSVARSPGATDNGGGTVSLLKIAEHFSKHKPKRDLRIIFFSGEELGLLGSQHYVNSHEDEMKNKSSLVLNIDVSGDPIARSRIAVTGSKQLLGYSDGVLKETGLCIDHSLDIYSSDQMPFTIHEIPGISVARFAGKGSFNIHTPKDHPRFVTAEGLREPILAGRILLDRILNAAIYPVRKEIDSSLKEKIEQYLWNLSFEEPKLMWSPKYKR
jgi:aminopeptidase YwaD